MGFTTGFTGGVTLTLSLAYLGALAHQRNRERQAAILRQQTLTLTALHDPRVPKLPPVTRAERIAEERRSLVDAAKDRWNAEIEHAARWAQTKDWEEARYNFEDTIAALWARAFGDAAGSGSAAVVGGDKAKSEARSVSEKVEKKAEKVVSDAKSNTSSNSSAGGVFSALGKGFERGKDAISNLGRAKVDVEAKAEEKLTSGLSPEEKVMKQRYQKSGSDDRSAEEILAERYLPTDKKNNTQLKGL